MQSCILLYVFCNYLFNCAAQSVATITAKNNNNNNNHIPHIMCAFKIKYWFN